MSCPAEDALDRFLPPVSAWFRDSFCTATAPQRAAWPAIASGQHVLLVAPTGSGKTLAAFLAAIDHLARQPRGEPGVRILYISPLKALNEDIARNLRGPLEGISRKAEALGEPLPPITQGVRTGDTSPAERQRLIRRPPDILITTPESLHLMLTSRARETLRRVSHVIVDEIHALAPNKRGVFLALLLERLEAIQKGGSSFVRIGLSATQRPLEEVARFLGGQTRGGDGRVVPRPVTIVDAGIRKDLDLRVEFPAARADGVMLPGPVWPAIEGRLRDLIASHRSTIVFANNRRVVERLTARLNEAGLAARDLVEDSGETDGDAEETELARSHHGSLSLDQRRQTEEQLKAGTLPAVVATASLELGIDMGAVELVCQVESPGNVARGLQRVGRAGHLVGRTSKGRLLAKTPLDLLESAALARAMAAGAVEALRVPSNSLDILAQQVVACVGVERWDVAALFELVRQAYPYRNLTPAAFDSVLELVSGRFHLESFRDLAPRVSWDRVHNRLHPLPGTARQALVGGGTIPDTGQFPVHLGRDGPRLGELDEEFVLERRVGETFVLGSSTWRIDAIEPQRVLVTAATGREALMPFWRGEGGQRTAELGLEVGGLCRGIADRLGEPEEARIAWLAGEYRLDPAAARILDHLVERQARLTGAVPDDRTVVVETFRDQAGELGLAILTPWGGKLHHGLKLVLQASLERRLGITPACLHANEGLLVRLPGTDEPPTELFRGLDPATAREWIREQLGESALFGLRFRQSAGRALLLPRPDPAKRTPLWLQRLRAKDLLQAVRQFPDFPIVVETYRECLDEDLDLPRLEEFLGRIADGTIRVVERHGEIPSPFTANLMLRFSTKYLYEWDEPRPRAGAAATRREEVSEDLLFPLLAQPEREDWLDARAVERLDQRLRGFDRPPRTADELAERLRVVGDLSPSECVGPILGQLDELAAAGRAGTIVLEGTAEPLRWILEEERPIYEAAFGSRNAAGAEREAGLRVVLLRFLRSRSLVGLDDLVERYPIDLLAAEEWLERWVDEGRLVRLGVGETGDAGGRWADRTNAREARRLTLALQRREAVAIAPEAFADFVLRRQHVHPATRLEGSAALETVLESLRGVVIPAESWERRILPARLADYQPRWLDDLLGMGSWTWIGRGVDPRVAIVPRAFPMPAAPEDPEQPITAAEAAVLDWMRRGGGWFVTDLAGSTGLDPSVVRKALDGLVSRGLVANDRFQPLRPAARAAREAMADHASRLVARRTRGWNAARGGGRRALPAPEGRWFVTPAPVVDEETQQAAWIEALLDRYGVLCRETVAMESAAPAWSRLWPALDRLELRGELRRGYFVEGLSGLQYTDSETAEALSEAAALARESLAVLVPAADPANLYGAGAPLDIPLLEGGTASLSRGVGNALVLIAGRPVLIIEAYGKRLTGLASASESDLRRAVARLPEFAGRELYRITVETYNAAAVLASPAAPWLQETGFVRDLHGLTFYAGTPRPQAARLAPGDSTT